MSNGKYSRDKGKRGELDIVHKLGGSAKRTGHAFLSKPDVTSDFAVYSVKNKSISGNTIINELGKLQKQAPQHHHFVAFKPSRGKWLICETLDQFKGDHGETLPKEQLGE